MITSSASSDNMNYKQLFKEILLKSIKTNCLCYYLNHRKRKRSRYDSVCVFDNYGAYLDDDDDDESMNQVVNDASVQEEDESEVNGNNCNTSCYQKMQQLYSTLSSCFSLNEEEIGESEREKFSNFWSNCILSKHPIAVDNYGSSIFHYATSNNNIKLLRCLLELNKDGVQLCDSKGMTILTRACQKNYVNICKYLLTETNANPNGSAECIYTPLLTSITNGFYDQAKLLLESNAYPSYIGSLDSSPTNNQFNLILSPIRSAIIYEKLQILSLLLKYGTNVDEIIANGSLRNAKPVDYLNCLKFLFRHLNEAKFAYMIELNDYIENVNVYRMMSVAFMLSLNPDEASQDNDYVFEEFVMRVKSNFDTSSLTFTQTLIWEYLIRLVNSFYRPKSLKQLCRFSIRKHIVRNNDRNFRILNRIDFLPNSLKMYLLHEN